MSTVQDQAGPRKRKKPQGIDGPPAASRQEERNPSPASVYPTLPDEGGQTPSDAGQVGFSPPQPAPVHSDREPQPQAVGTAFQDYLIGIKEVERRTGMCRSTINYLMRYSDFPLPLKLGVKMKRWWSGEVNQWLLSRPRAKGDLGKWHSRVEDQDSPTPYI